jgi:transcriptional regulator with XRE-family HTH domain
MGRRARPKPTKLAGKLVRIRSELNLSQSEMIRKLGFADYLRQSHISAFELGTREPPLLVLLRYAQVAGLTMEMLVNDDTELPKQLKAFVSRR